MPTRLRQLELGLPAPGREPADGFTRPAEAGRPEADHHVEADHAEPDEAGSGPAELGQAEPGHLDAVTGRAEPDLALPRRSPAADPGDQDAGHAVGRPDRNDPISTGGNGRARHEADRSGSADLSLGPWQAGGGAARPASLGGRGSVRGGNGNGHHQQGQLPRSQGLSRGQQDAARQDTVQHPVIGPGAVRPKQPDTARFDDARAGAADSDLGALVDRILAGCRAAEGQTLFGTYGSSGLTPAIHRIAAQLPVDGLAPGSEADSLKQADRLTAKLARLMARNPGLSAEEAAAGISDVVRYAFAFDAADYTEASWLVHRKLKSQGFELEVRRNRWESPECKAIFTRWHDPAHGLAFEVQFHTTASWAVLRQTHDAYVRITDPATPPDERARLRARQVAAAAAAKAPRNWTELADFRLERR